MKTRLQFTLQEVAVVLTALAISAEAYKLSLKNQRATFLSGIHARVSSMPTPGIAFEAQIYRLPVGSPSKLVYKCQFDRDIDLRLVGLGVNGLPYTQSECLPKNLVSFTLATEPPFFTLRGKLQDSLDNNTEDLIIKMGPVISNDTIILKDSVFVRDGSAAVLVESPKSAFNPMKLTVSR